MKALFALALMASFALPDQKDCIADGETKSVSFEVDPNEWPRGRRLVDDENIRGWDEDTYSEDDLLGRGSGKQDEDLSITVSIEIGNKNGWLSGPNGVTHNHNGEGDCLEVYVTYEAFYWIDVYVFGGGSYKQEVQGEFRTEARKICPC